MISNSLELLKNIKTKKTEKDSVLVKKKQQQIKHLLFY